MAIFQKYKKFIIILLFFLIFFSNAPGIIAGTDFKSRFNTSLNETAKGTGHMGAVMSKKDPGEIIGMVIKILLGLLGIVFLALIIYGGYTWMLARGNDQEAQKALNIIQAAVIGLIIVLAAYAVTAFAINAIGMQTTPPENINYEPT